MVQLIAEIKRRNVFKVGAAYLALGWIVLEVSDTVAPALNLPDWTTALLLWIGLAGFAFVLIFSWIFELTPEGLKREADIDRSASLTHETGRRLDYLIIGLLVVAIAVFAFSRLQGPATVPASASSLASGADNRLPRSIAVLPFVNMSDDKSNEYFGDGLAEELLNLLAKVQALRVAARTSSFHFKDKNPTIAEVAAALQVDTVLEGSVRRSGDTIRVVAQLISADDGAHLWSEKYDRPLTDIFKVQDNIADQIVMALLPYLDAELMPPPSGDSGEISPQLFERFLWARHRYYQGTRRAADDAHAELLAVTDAAPGSLRVRQGRFEEAEAALDRALALDPALVDARIERQHVLAVDDQAARRSPLHYAGVQVTKAVLAAARSRRYPPSPTSISPDPCVRTTSNRGKPTLSSLCSASVRWQKKRSVRRKIKCSMTTSFSAAAASAGTSPIRCPAS